MQRYRSRRGLASAPLAPLLDVIFLLVVVLMVITRVQLPFINPPPKGEVTKASELAPTAIYTQVSWQFNAPHDLDTYMSCKVHLPFGTADVQVNYKQKQAGFLTLDRDDLGRPSPDNFEVVAGNSEIPRLPPNTVCTLNVHVYSTRTGSMPITGVFHVILHKDHPDEEILTPIEGQPYSLNVAGEEVTLAEIVLDENGQLLREAVGLFPDAVFRCLATCKKEGD